MRHHERLEAMWAEANGLDPKGMVACSSGTAALHLALEAMGCLQIGDESTRNQVILSDYNMIACARAVTLAGMSPSLTDCDDRSLMEIESYKQSKNRGSSAVMATHIYGRRCDMDMIACEAEPRGLYVIEDLAEAHGVRPHRDTDAACWSFYKNKIVYCANGEGGAVWFRNPDHAKRARSLRCLGFTEDHNFEHIPRGHNYRLADPLAWLIQQSVTRVDDNLKRRRDVESYYDKYCPSEWKMPPRDVVWVYDIRIPGMGRETQTRFVTALRDSGIDARHGFWPLSLQKEYRGCRLERTNVYQEPLSHTMGREVIYLPAHLGITESQAERAFEIIKSCVGRS